MDCLSYDEMYPLFDAWLEDKSSHSHRLSVINTHICVSALFNKELRDLYNSADIVGIDSMPFLMWARIFYKKNADRFYAPDLMLEVSGNAKEKGYTFFLYGGYADAPDEIEEYLLDRHQGIQVVGKYSPPFRALSKDEDDEICQMINHSGADFLWIGLGSPKQDVWIYEHADKLKGCIMMPSGATFDFFSGRIQQAPKWIRDSGFEWLFRLTQDFRRLLSRYTIYNIVFIVAFLFQQLRIISFDKKGNLLLFGQLTKLGN